jgi:hypothetical protein
MNIFYSVNIVTVFHISQHHTEVCFEFLTAVLVSEYLLLIQLEPDTV